MDPQQRLLLEVTWEALEDAGQRAGPPRAAAAPGVFVGITSSDYAHARRGERDARRYSTPTPATGTALQRRAGQALLPRSASRGPASPSTPPAPPRWSRSTWPARACAAGESRPGARRRRQPHPDAGRARSCCRKTAGARARRPLQDLRRRGRRLRARRGRRRRRAQAACPTRSRTAIASSPSSAAPRSTTTARAAASRRPNGSAQQALVREALANAGVEPHHVDYVEAHGTATPLGDPIEVRALAAALGAGREPERPILLGSVKTNIGHLEAGAGIAGLIKVALSLQHGEIPPHLHFKTPNPYIEWDRLPARVATTRIPWPSVDGRRIAGVSSFGASGTNAHVVLGGAPAPQAAAASAPERPAEILCVSARSERRCACSPTVTSVTSSPTRRSGSADVCFTARAGRAHFAHRLSVVASSREQLSARLGCVRAGRASGADGAGPRGAKGGAAGGVPVHGAGVAVRGDGAGAVRDRACVPAGDRGV